MIFFNDESWDFLIYLSRQFFMVLKNNTRKELKVLLNLVEYVPVLLHLLNLVVL